MKWNVLIPCFLIVIIFFSFGITGCKESSELKGDPAGVLVQYTGCKNQQESVALDGVMASNMEDCFQYSYDGKSTLVLKHVNAGFNCCPSEIIADIQINGNSISIVEKELEHGCHCLCLFDLDYEIINMYPGEYTIRVTEPYAESGDQAMEFSVHLSGAANGNFCLDRNHYPWAQ